VLVLIALLRYALEHRRAPDTVNATFHRASVRRAGLVLTVPWKAARWCRIALVMDTALRVCATARRDGRVTFVRSMPLALEIAVIAACASVVYVTAEVAMVDLHASGRNVLPIALVTVSVFVLRSTPLVHP
jgi:hypothetical protein